MVRSSWPLRFMLVHSTIVFVTVLVMHTLLSASTFAGIFTGANTSTQPEKSLQTWEFTAPGYMVDPNALPEKFTITTHFTYDVKGPKQGVVTVGLSSSPDGPPTLVALALTVPSTGGFFGVTAGLKLISTGNILGTSKTDTYNDYTYGTWDYFNINSAMPISSTDTYTATLSMDRKSGLTSVRLTSDTGLVLVEGSMYTKPISGPVYAGFGTLGTGQTGQAWSLQLHRLDMQSGNERLGRPFALQQDVFLRITELVSGREVLADPGVTYTDIPLEGEVFGVPAGMPGNYRIVATNPNKERIVLWSGNVPAGQDKVKVPLRMLPAGHYEIALQYIEPEYELELARGEINLIAVTVEGFLQVNGPAGNQGNNENKGQIILQSDRNVSDATLKAFSVGDNDVSGNKGLLWEGHVSLEAGKPLTIPVTWELDEPFTYALAYTSSSEPINFVQTARHIPLDHPFLLVNVDSFPELRARATTSPWKEMKEEASKIIKRMAFHDKEEVYEQALALRDIFSAGTLMYILDPANRSIYLTRLREAFAQLDDLARLRAQDIAAWAANVPVANATFLAILALDVVYYDVTAAERQVIEQNIGKLVDEIEANAYYLSVYSLHGTWALYRGDRQSFEQYKRLYREQVFTKDLTADGVFGEGPGYAFARYAYADREQKYLFMDILEATGEDTYYSEPRLQQFYEWLFAHSVAPDGRSFTFGDTSAITPITARPVSTAFYRAYRFSKEAGDYAAWWSSKMQPPGSLTAYVLLNQVPTPRRPDSSTIYTGGGAWLLNAEGSDSEALAGVLWNPQLSEGHSHKDVNALHLFGYGKQLLVNSGYSTWRQGALGFSWTYTHDSAVSSNTVLIDQKDHRLKRGAGIESGFVTSSLAWARGNSGEALFGGVHLRNLIQVAPAGLGGGYWLLVDRVAANNEQATMSVAMHPNSSVYTTVAPNLEYKWDIDSVSLSLFLATPPQTVEVRDGLLAGSGGSIVGKFLYTTYPADQLGTRSAITVLFPHDTNHAKATLTRLQSETYSGVQIEQGEKLLDTVLESGGNEVVSTGEVSFQGKTSMFRTLNGDLVFYYVEKGRAFTAAAELGLGFSSEADITIFMEGNKGKIDAPGTTLKLFRHDITAVKLNQILLPNANSGPSWVEVYVPEGIHDIELVTR